MQRLAAGRPAPPAKPSVPRGKHLAGLLVGVVLVAAGLAAGWFVATTPFLASLATPRPTTTRTLLGAIGWAAGLSVPVLLTGAGTLRFLRAIEGLRPRRPSSPLGDLVAALADDHTLVEGVRLPGGRPIGAIVVGPFGAAILELLPPRGMTRRRGEYWELRVGPREFLPIENPLDRAARNAERFRRWLLEEDQDHVVRVYAAVVGDEPGLARTPSVAVVPPSQLAAWFRALPAQRGLTAWRRQNLTGRLVERAG
ncbi:MAG: hypothetical protein C4343_07500 [Chloroflexota bacterium]